MWIEFDTHASKQALKNIPRRVANGVKVDMEV
jgi:hypothetical protein